MSASSSLCVQIYDYCMTIYLAQIFKTITQPDVDVGYKVYLLNVPVQNLYCKKMLRICCSTYKVCLITIHLSSPQPTQKGTAEEIEEYIREHDSLHTLTTLALCTPKIPAIKRALRINWGISILPSGESPLAFIATYYFLLYVPPLC